LHFKIHFKPLDSYVNIYILPSCLLDKRKSRPRRQSKCFSSHSCKAPKRKM